MLHMTRMNPGI